MNLSEATQALIAAILAPSPSKPAVDSASKAYVATVTKASTGEREDALRSMGQRLGDPNQSQAAILAILCGTLVEQGCDPLTIAAPLFERISSLLDLSAALARACVAQMPMPKSDEAYPAEAFEQQRQRLAPEMQHEAAAWLALDRFWPPAISVLSASRSTREVQRRLRSVADEIAPYHEAGHWLGLMLSVLDDEPFLAIEPSTRVGILGKFSGVVENFQLNVLLMDALPKAGFLSRRRVSARAADVARGKGPQEADETITGVWNLYTWKAIGPQLTLPDPNNFGASEHWIWNEGKPEDIPVFEGRRVILLGPASYPRSWRSQRMFDRLPASLDIERKLTKEEARAWLQKMDTARA